MRKREYMKVVLFLLSLAMATTAVLLSSPELAAEQRCNELAANCVCSEPLNSATITNIGNGFWNPDDSTTKECTVEFGQPTGFAILADDFDHPIIERHRPTITHSGYARRPDRTLPVARAASRRG